MRRQFPLAVYLAAWLLTGVAIALIWHWSRLDRLDLEQLMRWSAPFAHHPAAPAIITSCYLAASFLFFPRPLLTLAFVVIFGPWRTAIYGLVGLLLAAAVAFWFGALHGMPRTWTSVNDRLDAIRARLQRGGIFSVLVIRMIPAAPFTIVNVFAGALGIRFTDFIIGSLFGLLPGTATTIVLGDRLLAALRFADWENTMLALGLAAAGIITFVLLRRTGA